MLSAAFRDTVESGDKDCSMRETHHPLHDSKDLTHPGSPENRVQQNPGHASTINLTSIPCQEKDQEPHQISVSSFIAIWVQVHRPGHAEEVQ